MFGAFDTDQLDEQAPRLGGYAPVETDGYVGTIKLAYAGKSPNSDSRFVEVIADINGQEYKERFYICSKTGQPFYEDKKDPSKKRPLPGLVHIDHMCLMTTGQKLAEQDVEDKVVMLWDTTVGAETHQTVPVLIDLLGKEVGLAINKVTQWKQKKVDGRYVDSDETQDINELDFVYHPENNMVVDEIRREVEEASHYPAWIDRNKGKTKNKTKSKPGKQLVGGAPQSGLGAASSNSTSGKSNPFLK